ncbi:MAG: hypothetical protein JZU60_01945 [Ilumatobacteraceae bacterium]|jgi:hypothetical protein|nr:hypothetical protein [Ilumatobacteraceae bacterium]
MIEIEHIQTELDALAEYQAQKDSIEAHKCALLDEVKVPLEVMAVMSEGNKRIQIYEENQRKAIEKTREEIQVKLDAIKIPEEIRLAYEEIARQRELVNAYQYAKQNEYQDAIFAKRNEVQAEMQAATAQVYEDIAQRKRDIEIEFSGKLGAVDENIEALKKEIEADVLKRGESVKGKYYHAVWNKGRVGTWNSGKLDGLALIMPAIAECRNPGGEPTVTFRSIK